MGGGPQLPWYVVGGDFLTRPHKEDAEALHPTDLRRWGPEGDVPYRLVVPPRAHLAAWAQRCAGQMKMEAAGSVLVWCAMVARDQCGGRTSLECMKSTVPQAAPPP